MPCNKKFELFAKSSVFFFYIIYGYLLAFFIHRALFGTKAAPLAVIVIDALNLFSACPEDFDLVITDHNMPLMTGIMLSEKLQKIREGIPVILCTGNACLVKKEDLKKARIGVLLDKPYTLRELHSAIQKILESS